LGAPERIRVVTILGSPWFILADVCRVLEITDTTSASRRLDADEKQTLSADMFQDCNMRSGNFNGLGTFGAMPIIISESGLYSLILTSRKPQAKAFKRWITSTTAPGPHPRLSSASGQSPRVPRPTPTPSDFSPVGTSRFPWRDPHPLRMTGVKWE